LIAGPRSVTAVFAQYAFTKSHSPSILLAYPRFTYLRPTHHAPLRRQPAHSSVSVASTHFRRTQKSIAQRSPRHRLTFPAGSFLGGFRTPASVQAAAPRSAGIRNPQQKRPSPARLAMSEKCQKRRCRLGWRQRWAIWVHCLHTGHRLAGCFLVLYLTKVVKNPF
jgi:hypothetical protein